MVVVAANSLVARRRRASRDDGVGAVGGRAVRLCRVVRAQRALQRGHAGQQRATSSVDGARAMTPEYKRESYSVDYTRHYKPQDPLTLIHLALSGQIARRVPLELYLSRLSRPALSHAASSPSPKLHRFISQLPRMGLKHLEYLAVPSTLTNGKVFGCRRCKTHLTTSEQIESKVRPPRRRRQGHVGQASGGCSQGL